MYELDEKRREVLEELAAETADDVPDTQYSEIDVSVMIETIFSVNRPQRTVVQDGVELFWEDLKTDKSTEVERFLKDNCVEFSGVWFGMVNDRPCGVVVSLPVSMVAS